MDLHLHGFILPSVAMSGLTLDVFMSHAPIRYHFPMLLQLVIVNLSRVNTHQRVRSCVQIYKGLYNYIDLIADNIKTGVRLTLM